MTHGVFSCVSPGPRYSFGSAGRDAYQGQYLSAAHSSSSSMFGKNSPGPATYNTRSGPGTAERARWEPNSFTMGKRLEQMKSTSTSPGPKYMPNAECQSTRGPAYSMGSGHGDSVATATSPGPIYSLNQSRSSGGAPAYTFRGGRLRSEDQAAAASRTVLSPGPGSYEASLNAKSSSPAYKFGTGRRGGGRKKAVQSPGPNHYGVKARR